MKAEDKSFFFMASSSYYDIPFFQRAYVWNEENWDGLLDNLTCKGGSHFLGSIILKNEMTSSGSEARYSVIDGQQRLTTLSILLRACYDHIVKYSIKYEFDEDTVKNCQLIMERLLFVQEGGIKRKLFVKINHSHLDKKAYETVIKGNLKEDEQWERFVDSSDENASSIIKAYAFFRDALEEMNQDSVDYLWGVLTDNSVKFLVNIDLGANDNEQEIFDTVNSAGVRLSSADTIKNLLYQRYVDLLRKTQCDDPDENAVKEYESTWVDAFLSDESVNAYWEKEKLYGRIKRSNIETFLHSFAVVNGFFNPAEDTMADLSQGYRKSISNLNIDLLHDYLVKLHDYALVYKQYFGIEDKLLKYEDYIGRLFNICNSLEVSTFYPYMLQLLYSYNNSLISEDELKCKFFSVEKYLIQNAICKGSTKNYNNECIQLVEGRKTPEEILSDCGYISEDSFSLGLRRMTTNKLPTLILFWVELYQRSTVYSDLQELKYNYTLEHIMPQKWTKNWSDVPTYDISGNLVTDTDEIDRIRSHAIYEIGNMTLLNSKLNTSISNGTFKDKIFGKSGKNGINKLADLQLTKDVIQNNKEWNELKIYSRTEELEEIIKDIWDANNLPEERRVTTRVGEGGRHQLRLQFWEKALPIIKEKNAFECFSNVNPSTSYLVSGYFGIGGFSVTCMAQFDKACVTFFMGKRAPEKNKKAFDILYSHKEEIENQIGDKLIWDRGNDNVASWISHSLDDVSISNTSDWDKMAEYLGNWSVKLRRTLLPYLKEYADGTPKNKNPEKLVRLQSLSEIYKAWMGQKDGVIPYFEKSNRTYSRFTTPRMNEMLPVEPGVLSDWNCESHYFYEIINKSCNSTAIKLAYNSKGISQETRDRLNRINDIVSRKQWGDKWIWWTAFKSSRFSVPDDLDKDQIFEGLDALFNEVIEFETSLVDALSD